MHSNNNCYKHLEYNATLHNSNNCFSHLEYNATLHNSNNHFKHLEYNATLHNTIITRIDSTTSMPQCVWQNKIVNHLSNNCSKHLKYNATLHNTTLTRIDSIIKTLTYNSRHTLTGTYLIHKDQHNQWKNLRVPLPLPAGRTGIPAALQHKPTGYLQLCNISRPDTCSSAT